MKNILKYKGYEGSVEFYADDRIFHGRLLGINDIITFQGDSVEGIEKDFQEVVEDYLEACADHGNEPEKTNTKRGRILKKAYATINGERQDSYGNPEDSFKIIAALWTIYLKAEGLLPEDKELSPLNVAVMMSLFKHARMSGQKPSADNFVDAAGYLGIAGDMLPE